MDFYRTEKYRQLIEYIDANLKHGISSQQIEQVSHYSYRNMNRIFLALQGETIGRHIKRRRLEKAAEYLNYSTESVSEISFELGFNDIASFSKAFKNKYGCAPTEFREKQAPNIQSTPTEPDISRLPQLDFTFETLPSFEYLYSEYHGDYEDAEAIEKLWQGFLSFCGKHQLQDTDSIFFGTILDDNDITDTVFCRYRTCLLLKRSVKALENNDLYITKHTGQLYAKFIHQGKASDTTNTYRIIYGQWMSTVKRAFADLPTLEFYHTKPGSSLVFQTDIYIPIL